MVFLRLINSPVLHLNSNQPKSKIICLGTNFVVILQMFIKGLYKKEV